jgi:hypothetical protein
MSTNKLEILSVTPVYGEIEEPGSYISREERTMSERTEPPTRPSAEIDDRIARLAIRWHYEEDAQLRGELLSAAAALYWASDPTCEWTNAPEFLAGYVEAVLKAEGLI